MGGEVEGEGWMGSKVVGRNGIDVLLHVCRFCVGRVLGGANFFAVHE